MFNPCERAATYQMVQMFLQRRGAQVAFEMSQRSEQYIRSDVAFVAGMTRMNWRSATAVPS